MQKVPRALIPKPISLVIPALRVRRRAPSGDEGKKMDDSDPDKSDKCKAHEVVSIFSCEASKVLARQVYSLAKHKHLVERTCHDFKTRYPDVKRLYEEAHVCSVVDSSNSSLKWFKAILFCRLRHGCSAVGYPVGGPRNSHAYGPYVPESSLLDGIREILDRTEPRVKIFLPLLSSIRRHPAMECNPLEDWVYENGRRVIIGIIGRAPSTPGFHPGTQSKLAHFVGVPGGSTKPTQAEASIMPTAREEIATMIAKADFTAENLGGNSLPFLNACIRESLRINTPIACVAPRMATADAQLGEYVIPAGTSLTVDIYAIHHTERVWKDPHAFRPERFETETLKSWVPFVLGGRQSPARNFALYEQRALVAVILREYQWELPVGSKHSHSIQNAFSPFALTVPHELHLTFRKI
ncbi:cytochrome P450 [Mycena vulgaris]|nr:cytochrome P450 [Mycena vulgaris]